MSGDAKPVRMSLVDRAETMLLGFASGALTGAACLAVVKRQFGRRDKEDDGPVTPTEATATGSSDDEQPAAATALHPRPKPRQKEPSLGGALPVFPGGPLQHATELLHEIKEARAAASASVAEFKNLVSCQGLDSNGPPAPDLLLQQQLGPLDADLLQLDVHGHPVTTHSQDLEPGAVDQQGLVDTPRKTCQQQSQRMISARQFLEQQDLPLNLQQQLQLTQQQTLMAQQELARTSAELSAAQAELLQLRSCRANLQTDVSSLMAGLEVLGQQVHTAAQQHCVAQGHLIELEQGVTFQQQQHASVRQSAGCSGLQVPEKPEDTQTAQAQAVATTKERLQQTTRVQKQMQAALSAASALTEESWENLLQIDKLLQQQHHVQATSALQVEQQDKVLPEQAAAAGQAAHAQSLQEGPTRHTCQPHMNQAGASSEQLQELQVQLTAARAAAASLQQQLAAAQEAHETRLHSLELRSRAREQQVEALQAELEATAAQLEEAEQQVQGLQYTAHKRLEMMETLEAQLAEAQLAEAQQVAPAAASVAAMKQERRGAADAATVMTAAGAGAVAAGSAGEKTKECQHTYSCVAHAPREVGSPSIVPLAAAVLQALSGAGDGQSCEEPLSWLRSATAQHEPPNSLLEELRHESDELSEQLAQLQQYLKASSAKFGRLDSIKAMDASLHALQRVAGDTVKVATSTVERVRDAAGVRSAPTSVGGAPALARRVAAADKLPAKQVSCAGVMEGATPAAAASPCPAHSKSVAMRRLGLELPRLQPWGSAAQGSNPDVTDDGEKVRAAAADQATPGDEVGRCTGVTPGSCATPGSAGLLSCLASCEAEGLDWHLDLPEAECNWLGGDLQLEQELSTWDSPQTQAELTLTHSTTSNAPMLQAHTHSSSQIHRGRSSTAGGRDMAGGLLKWGSGAMRVSHVGLGPQDMPGQQQQPGAEQQQPPCRSEVPICSCRTGAW